MKLGDGVDASLVSDAIFVRAWCLCLRISNLVRFIFSFDLSDRATYDSKLSLCRPPRPSYISVANDHR